jgi:hypothetical protein
MPRDNRRFLKSTWMVVICTRLDMATVASSTTVYAAVRRYVDAEVSMCRAILQADVPLTQVRSPASCSVSSSSAHLTSFAQHCAGAVQDGRSPRMTIKRRSGSGAPGHFRRFAAHREFGKDASCRL